MRTRGMCQAPGCLNEVGPGRRRFCSDICQQRGRRHERVTETGDFGKAAVRMIRTLARRVGASDIDEFAALWEVRAEADRAAAAAIDDLRAAGFSWAEIAAQTGASKQALSQWHKRRAGQPSVNGTFTEEGR